MKVIAFYLPQYHPIPENDLWWGHGFTEWVNVAAARPRFHGHYQPHIPADLGFYDLRQEETRIAQAEMAKQYGIDGFCYYHYWFNEKMLLEKPFNEVLLTGKPDFPFCLCWANENWTRRWDGKDHEILMKQDYANYDPSRHMAWLSAAFQDRRYIRINDRPLLLIYKAIQIPHIKKMIQLWRQEAKSVYGMDLYLCSVKNWGKSSMSGETAIKAGFDAIVDFQPDMSLAMSDVWMNILKNFPRNAWNVMASKLHIPGQIILSETNTYQYETIVKNWIQRGPAEHKEFPCVAPYWDNSPRKRICSIVQNDRPEWYGKWLAAACDRAMDHAHEERIVFINAWNEWGEGCHLEPDVKFGRKFLEITHETLNRFRT